MNDSSKSLEPKLSSHPLISVIVPAFNVDLFIASSLQSILDQSYKNLEILIIDDHSTDRTVAIAREYTLQDARIRVITNSRKKGVAGARNTGILEARGEWCVFLDSDDLWAPDAIQQRILATELYPQVNLFSGDYAEFTEDVSKNLTTRARSNIFWNKHFKTALMSGHPILIARPGELFVQSCLTHTISIMVKRSLLNDVGRFNEALPTAEDVHLWLRLAASVDSFVFVPRSLAYYRIREGSLTHSGKSVFHDAVDAYLDLLGDPILAQFRKDLIRQLISFSLQNTYFYRRAGNKLQAIYWAMRTVTLAPLVLLHWKNLLATFLLR